MSVSDDTEALITYGDRLADWVNEAAPAIYALLLAYERRIRSDCKTLEELANEPWRCAEFIEAERVLFAKPTNIVELP